jgi:GNAT superfamily N-acetyltransferase
MSFQLVIADQDRFKPQIREIFWEYLQWGNLHVSQEYNVSLDIASMLESDMAASSIYLPPRGCMLLALIEDQVAGIACLKPLEPVIGEIKRMYVRPEHRNKGLGHALIQRLIQEAGLIGYRRLRLDSAGFMQAAHRLYRSVGFREVEPYPGSEVPQEFQKYWIFMELELA